MKITAYNHLLISAITFIAICLVNSACSKTEKEKEQYVDYSNSLFETLYGSNELSIIIETDVDQILINKEKDEKVYQDATIKITGDGLQPLNGSCKIRPRGVTRKKICDFPPLMINVNDSQEEALGFGKSENIKLVSYCKDSLDYEDWIAKEYIAYKLYNELSEESFRVQVVSVTYKDRNKRHEDITKAGFIIEPLEELSSRVACNILEDDAAIKNVHKDNYKKLTMFQFMIGNTDWNLSNRHNVRLLSCDPEYGPELVPYDFDYSGLVNARYANPHPMLPIEKVTDRLFQWRGSVDEDFSETVNYFNKKRVALVKALQLLPFNSEKEKDDMANYISDFYQLIATPGQIKKEILRARKK